MHKHIGVDDDDVTVHGGHFHEHDDRGDHVIDLQSLAAASSVHHAGETPLLMMMTLAAVLWILCPLLLSALLPVSAPVCSAPSKQTYWRPPLRGPPLSLV